MKLIPHLVFAGECEAAFQLYASCMDGTIAFLKRHGESGETCSAEMVGKVFHATLRIGDQVVTGVDLMGEEYKRPQGFSLQLNLRDREKASLIFETLSEAGMVHFPMQATMWAEAYGALTDRFGTPWEINCGPGA